jgi:3-oxoacyl-[acyl-carrier protein] reductase
MELGLKDKVVLLTGGSGGIGRPLARAFAREGARVALTYLSRAENARTVAAEIEAAGGQALPVRLDLTDRQSADQAVAEITKKWGGIDVLVLNASASGGPSNLRASFEEVTAEQWLPSLRTEIEGAFHTVQATLPAMKPRGAGRIVFMSASIVKRGMKGEEGYATSKAALHGLSTNLSTELFEHGILSNVVAPGPVVTEGLLEKLPPELSGQVSVDEPEHARRVLNKAMPFLHFSTVDDVVNSVLFLGSPANGNITGNVLYVDGGH